MCSSQRCNNNKICYSLYVCWLSSQFYRQLLFRACGQVVTYLHWESSSRLLFQCCSVTFVLIDSAVASAGRWLYQPVGQPGQKKTTTAITIYGNICLKQCPTDHHHASPAGPEPKIKLQFFSLGVKPQPTDFGTNFEGGRRRRCRGERRKTGWRV